MTLLVAWAGADCKKRGSRTSSLYFASDSRISWNKKMDMMDNKKYVSTQLLPSHFAWTKLPLHCKT